MQRRLASLTTVLAVLALAAPAAAQLPPVPPHKPVAKDARLTIKVETGRVDRKVRYLLEGDKVLVRGHIWPYVPAQVVRLELYRDGKRIHTKTVAVQRDRSRKDAGKYQYRFKPVRKSARYMVRARHDATLKQQAGKSEPEHFRAIAGHVEDEESVRLLQISLRSLAFVSPLNGQLDDATRRAVLAYRKVQRWARTGSPTPPMFRKVFRGQGAFELRHKSPGKHVEGDLDRQVLVMVNHGKPQQIYTMSSGKPSTPTVQGTFQFYRKDPGANSEGMYYSSYFYGGYAVHGYPSVPATYPASHGCLRVPIPDAYRIYNLIDIGETIYVYD